MATVSLPSTVDTASGQPVLSPRRRTATLAAMCLAVGMIVAGVSSLNNALPRIAEDLHVSQSGQQWIVDAYAITLAAFLLPLGAVGDRYGRRFTLMMGVAVFGAASGAAALATTGGVLIAARAAMGVGAALAMPGTLSTITSVFPPESRAKAVGIWAGFAGAGGTLGMVISGLVLLHFGWESVFVVNLLLAALTLAMIVAAVPSTKATEAVAIDPLGSVLSAAGFGALVLGIIEGPERGWTDPLTLVALIGGAFLLLAFVRAELGSRAPLLDPRLFRSRGFATGSASIFLQFLGMFGFFFVSVQFLQLVLGYSALRAAVALLPMSIVFIPMSSVAATLMNRYGQRLVGATGLALSAVGFLLFSTLKVDSGYLPLLGYQLIFGLGAPLAMTPATTAIVSALPPAKQGVASAVNDTARELGAAFGVAILGSAFNIGYRHAIAPKLASLPADVAHGAHESPAIALDSARGLGSGSGTLVNAAKDSFVIGMRYALLVGAVSAVIGALYVWLRGPSRDGELADDALDEDLLDDVTALGFEPSLAD